MMTDPKRSPVIIGVGQINDRPDDPDRGLDSLGLMVAALKAAVADAGGGLPTDLDSLARLAQISFPHLDKLCGPPAAETGDRKGVVSGKRVLVRVDPGVRRIIKKNKNMTK